MEITYPQGNNVPIVTLTEQDIESAVRQFICTCHPELSKGYAIDPSREKLSRIPVACVYVAWPSDESEH